MQEGIGRLLPEQLRWSVNDGDRAGSRDCSPIFVANACGAGLVRIGAADDRDLGQREQPIQVDSRRPAASGNPDPQHRGAHHPTRLEALLRRYISDRNHARITPGPEHARKAPLNPSNMTVPRQDLYPRVKTLFPFSRARLRRLPESPSDQGKPEPPKTRSSIPSMHSNFMS